MPIKRIKVEDLPARRNRTLAMETPEWGDALAILKDGLRPHEAVQITLSPATVRKSKYIYRSFRSSIARHIKDLGLHYDVILRGKVDEPDQVVYIAGQPPAGRNKAEGTAAASRAA